MGRTLATGNVTHINSRNTHPVVMGKFLFSTPVYVHTGLGDLSFEGNTYTGVGHLASISGLEETEALIPAPVACTLDGFEPTAFSEAMNAANYGDKVVLYWGYRDDAGALIDEPWVFYRGRVETTRLSRGKEENSVSIIIQHELAVLNKKTGTKFTDEEQQRRYPGDTAFQRVQQMETVELTWGRRGLRVGNGQLTEPPRGDGPGDRFLP